MWTEEELEGIIDGFKKDKKELHKKMQIMDDGMIKKVIEILRQFNHISIEDIYEILEWLDAKEFLSKKGTEFYTEFWREFIKEDK